MTDAITGIDHCVILVRNLDAARERIAALGFTLTPRGAHSDHLGTVNHCIMLRGAYFEVLAIRKPTAFNARWRARLAQREGLDAVPVASPDVDTARAALIAQGLDPPGVIEFSRPVDLPEGPRQAAFRILPLPACRTPGTTMFVCQHLTREVVWHPSYLDHANGAQGIRCVTGVHARPAEMAPAYEKIFGAAAVRADCDAMRIDTGAGAIEFLTPARYAERFPGIAPDRAAVPPYLGAISIAVADRAAAASCLRARGVPYGVLPDGRICVAPAEACGTLIALV